ncbi:MAG: DUF2158 domain-containing protein [Xanthobacteraceae bacterium]
MTFAIGEVVTLKSGSPRMTVIAISGEIVSCTYFRAGAMATADFPAQALEPLDLPKLPRRHFLPRLFGVPA